jgi:hypothetical protein
VDASETATSAIARPRQCEADLEDALAAFLEGTGLFRVLRQVVGRPLWTACPAAGWVRCDLLLLASKRGLAAGWKHGPIVLEVKRPGEPIGPAVSQAMDYLRSSWTLPNGVPVLASWAFVYPAERAHGALASIMAQNRVGTATLAGGELDLWCGEQRVLTVCDGGTLRVGQVGIGRRFGGRRGGSSLTRRSVDI